MLITFNDTLYVNTIQTSDISIKVYGPENSYDFSWTAEYEDSSNVLVTMNFVSSLKGFQQETIVIDFINRDNFKSIYSKRGVNPAELSGYLNEYAGSQVSSEALGQTAAIIFLSSVGLALISSFGGNSMEMMWNLMNTLQLMYFLSYIYCEFPTHLEEFFTYLKYANPENEFLSYVTLVIIPESHFQRGTVNDRIGDKAFWVNSADKVPILVIFLIAFLFTLLFDLMNMPKRGK